MTFAEGLTVFGEAEEAGRLRAVTPILLTERTFQVPLLRREVEPVDEEEGRHEQQRLARTARERGPSKARPQPVICGLRL